MTQKNQEMMREIDKQYLETPFYGSRRMQQHLLRLGHKVGRGKVRRMMKLQGLTAIYPKPRTTIPDKAHKKYPYLLRGLKIDRPNQVWCTDITYIPVERGFFLSGGRDGLAQPQGFELAVVQHNGYTFLH